MLLAAGDRVGSYQFVITVTRDRLFYNPAEVRSNIWTTRIE